jgi:hypothetical protein
MTPAPGGSARGAQPGRSTWSAIVAEATIAYRALRLLGAAVRG